MMHTNWRRAALPAATVVTLAVLASAGNAAAHAAEEEESTVEVSVTVADTSPGVLAMTVEANTTTLTEQGSTALNRVFTGTLPTVTVTDTRKSVPDGAAWAVVASASDFTTADGMESISADQLGWAPAIVVGDDGGTVFAGEPVEGSGDGGPGLTDQELLFSTLDSGEVNPGTWSANAALRLQTSNLVEAGTYGSTITLSLFE